MGVLTIWLAAARADPGHDRVVDARRRAARVRRRGRGRLAGRGRRVRRLRRAAGARRPVAAARAADRADPGPLANAMLAGVLLSVCLAPVRFAADSPLAAAPIVITWAVLLRVARRWAIPGALVAAAIVVAVDPSGRDSGVGLLPTPGGTTPVFEPGALVGLALPLFIVTMASQNVTGMTVLATYGYRPRLPPVLAGHRRRDRRGGAVRRPRLNLAAISAALTAGPDGGRDPARRWVAAIAAGVTLHRARPLRRADRGVRRRRAAAADRGGRRARAARRPRRRAGRRRGERGAPRRGRGDARGQRLGVAPLGVSAPFWGLLAGLALLAVQHRRAGMSAPRNLVNLSGVGKGYAARTVLDDVTLGVAAGDRIGVVGRNGDGKSTLLRLIAGVEAPDAGTRHAHGHGVARAARPGRRPRPGAHDPRGARRRPRRPRVGRRPRASAPCSTGCSAASRSPASRRAGHADRAALGRRAAADRARAHAARQPRAAAARRADQPPRRRGRRLARAPPRRPPRHAAGRHPRPLVPRRRLHRHLGGRRRRRAPVRGRLRGVRAGARRARARSRPCARSAARACCARSSPGCAAGRRRARPSRASGSRPPRR